MSTSTTNFGFELPSKGEYPGTWDIPLNDNFRKADAAMLAIWACHSGTTPPTGAPEGGLWYHYLRRVLYIKSPDGYVNVISHTHNETDLPKIDLAQHTTGKLPAYMIDATSLDAATLGGKSKDNFFHMAGDGLASSGPLIGLAEACIPGTYNQVRVDRYGRVYEGSALTTTSHQHPEYALKGGSSTQQFDVATPSTPSNAVSLAFAQTSFHKLGGDSSKNFVVKEGTNGAEAINLAQANRDYASKVHNHDASYSPSNHRHDLDYSLITHTHPEFALITGGVTGLDAIYAKVEGDATKRFKAANALMDSECVTLGQATILYSPLSHIHAGYSPTSHLHTGVYSPTSHDHATTYAALVHEHSGQYSPTNHTHPGQYSDVNHRHDSTYAAIEHTADHAGYFAAKTHTHSEYSPTTHDHSGTYATVAHTHNFDSTYVKITGATLQGGLTFPSSWIATADGDVVTKANLTSAMNTVTQGLGIYLKTADANLAYAPKGGSSSLTFQVASPSVDAEAINRGYANATYAAAGHDHDLVYVKLANATINLTRQTTDMLSRNTVFAGLKSDTTGTPLFIEAAGTNLNLKATSANKFVIIISDGQDPLGDINKVSMKSADITSILPAAKGASSHWYLYCYWDTATADIKFDATDIVPLTSDNLPASGITGQYCYQPVANNTWKWDGAKWVAGQRTVFIGEFDTNGSSAITNLTLYEFGIQTPPRVSAPLGDYSAVNKKYTTDTFLSKTDATSTYLSKTDATSTYLTKTDATSIYQTKIPANTYMSYVAPDAAIANASNSVGSPTKAEFDAVVSKLNAALAALKSHGIIS